MLNPWRLRLLHQFHLLGTVRAVAESVQFSPSNVSAQLALLEKETRAQLFERVGRTMTLTPVGVTLAEHAADILDHMGSVETEIANLYSEPTGVIRVAAFSSAVGSIVIPAARELRLSSPRITVEVIEAEPHLSVPALHRGEVDLALSCDFGDGEVRLEPNLVTLPLMDDPIVLVVSQDRDFLASQRVPLSTFSAERWSFEPPASHLAKLTERFCRVSGFEPQVVGRFASFGALLKHVEADLSVALLPYLAVESGYRVHTIELEESPRRHIQLHARRPSMTRTAVRQVIEAITRQHAGTQQNGLPDPAGNPNLLHGHDSPTAHTYL